MGPWASVRATDLQQIYLLASPKAPHLQVIANWAVPLQATEPGLSSALHEQKHLFGLLFVLFCGVSHRVCYSGTTAPAKTASLCSNKDFQGKSLLGLFAICSLYKVTMLVIIIIIMIIIGFL